MRRLSSWISNCLLAAAAVGVAAGLGEIAVRLLFKEQTELFPRYHTDYQYGRYTLRGIRPGAQFWHTSADGSWKFVTNDRGFRNDRNFPYEKAQGTLRVLSLGDSHTQGYEVRQEATFSAVLERYLNARSKDGKIRAEVLNAGVSGFSTAEALAFLENEGTKYRPDAVVLGFYANDFADNLKAALYAVDERGALVERGTAHIPGVRIQNIIYAIPGVRWLGENSYFYSMLFNNVWAFFKERLRRGVFEYAVAGASGHSAQEVTLAAALVARMQRYCEERGIRFILVDIPARTAPQRFAASLPDEMRRALGAARVEMLDSREMLAEFDGAADLHVAGGHHHISELTHALIGVELGRRILK